MEVRLHIWYSNSLFPIRHKLFFRHLALLFVTVIFTFDTLTMVSVKLTVLWDLTSCSLVDRYQLLEDSFLHPEDTGIIFLKTFGTLVPKYAMSVPRKRKYSCSLFSYFWHLSFVYVLFVRRVGKIEKSDYCFVMSCLFLCPNITIWLPLHGFKKMVFEYFMKLCGRIFKFD
jgi:hypothetical protein